MGKPRLPGSTPKPAKKSRFMRELERLQSLVGNIINPEPESRSRASGRRDRNNHPQHIR